MQSNYVWVYVLNDVFGLISFTVTKHGLAVLLPLVKLILCALAVTIAFVVGCYLPIIKMIGVKTSDYVKIAFTPWFLAFSTCSSVAAFAVNIETIKKLVLLGISLPLLFLSAIQST